MEFAERHHRTSAGLDEEEQRAVSGLDCFRNWGFERKKKKSEHTFFDAGIQVRQFLVHFEGRWIFRTWNGRNEFFAETGQDVGIIQDMEACDAQSPFGRLDAGADYSPCLM